MDPHSTIDKNSAQDASRAEQLSRDWPWSASGQTPGEKDLHFPAENAGKSLVDMAQRDLDGTLQLLAERAQYITAATGAAIALRDGVEMVCRASGGTSAPEVGARLQVDSGLSGESIRTKQTLRCDDAATDLRVNRESCEALGIASVVVMPLLAGEEVIGVFELFSDKTNAFGTRDLTALERMANMVLAVLAQAASGHAGAAREGSSHEDAVPPGEGQRAGDDPATAAGDVVIHDTAGQPEAPAAAERAATAKQPIAAHRSNDTAEPTSNAAADELPASSEAAAVSPTDAGSEAGVPKALAASEVAFQGRMVATADTRDSVSVQTASRAAGDGEDVLEGVTKAASAAGGAVSPGEVVPGEAKTRPETTEMVSAPDAQAAPVGSGVAVLVPPQPPPEQAAMAQPQSEVTRLGRCQACGFPVSEGRQLCLDCEKKKAKEGVTATKIGTPEMPSTGVATSPKSVPTPVSTDSAEGMPEFPGEEPAEVSWLSAHKYMVVAIAVAVALIVVRLLVR